MFSFVIFVRTDGLLEDMAVECHPHELVVRLRTSSAFHGMVYPRGLDKKSACMAEFDVQYGQSIVYTLPLRSCNTMFTDSVSGLFVSTVGRESAGASQSGRFPPVSTLGRESADPSQSGRFPPVSTLGHESAGASQSGRFPPVSSVGRGGFASQSARCVPVSTVRLHFSVDGEARKPF